MANNTSLPAPYVSGKITVPANQVVNLLDLIQQQVQVNCPGTCVEFMLSADAGNTGSVAVGAASAIAGPLSATNYAYKLTPTSSPRIYRSTFPGGSTPIGELQVFAASASILYVEVQT